MKIQTITTFISILCLSLTATGQIPKYKADVPKSILTPDKVQTSYLGELNFFDGMPDEKTAQIRGGSLSSVSTVRSNPTLKGHGNLAISSWLNNNQDKRKI